MKLLRSAVAVGVAVAWAGTAAGQPAPDTVKFETTKLADGVYLLRGAGGNVGLGVGPDGAFLIDDELAPLTKALQAAVAAVTTQPLRFVLNTHWHFDHTGGNKDLGSAGVLIVAHDNVRVRMSTDQFIAAMNQKVPASPAVALSVVTFDSHVTLHLNGDDVEAIHLPPAHTDGDSIVVFKKANVIHAGDLFFNGFYPFFDLSSGGSFEGMIGAADRILALADEKTKIIPGHGPLGTRADLVAYRDMLVGIRNKVRPLMQAGKTAAEVIDAHPTAEYDATWGKGFLKPDDFTSLVYQSLARER
jgi:glyoxylase-like metal-dependent hydrolase (beta-lactamase superfamily II)